MRSLRKRFVSIFISITLGLLWCQPSFAGAPSGDGSVWSVDYAFALALNANGICLDRKYVSPLVNFFRSWLTENHYASALSAYNALDKADWGSKVSGMDEFTRKGRVPGAGTVTVFPKIPDAMQKEDANSSAVEMEGEVCVDG